LEQIEGTTIEDCRTDAGPDAETCPTLREGVNLNYFYISALTFFILMMIIISYKLEILITTIRDKKNSILDALSQINNKITNNNSELKYKNETHFKELMTQILHNAAEFYRLRDELKDREETPVAELITRKRRRPEPEETLPPKAGPKTSDKQL
jgi:hypothetical protein